SPLTLSQGAIDMGGNDLIFLNGLYAGANSGTNAWVQNGRIQLNTVASVARTFPFKAVGGTGALVLNPGAGTGPIGGSDITQVRASVTAAPSGAAAASSSFTGGTGGVASTTLTVATGSGIVPGMTLTGTGVAAGTTILSQATGTPGGAGTYLLSVSNTLATGSSLTGSAVNMTGTRGYQVDVITGTRFGTGSTFHSATIGFDVTDNLASNAQSLVLCQSLTGTSSGWAVRGAASAAGNLAATGTRLSSVATGNTGTTTAVATTTNTITLTLANANVAVGMEVVGTGIPAGTTVSSITSTTVFVLSNTVNAPASTTLTFFAFRPIQFASTMYFGLGRSAGFAVPAALNYSVTRTTANDYISIVPTADGGDGTGTAVPGITQTTTNDDVMSSAISLTGTT
ncbi:MAG: hypothetical protein ACKOSR_13530, partial [Flavobacteriales bacterium]